MVLRVTTSLDSLRSRAGVEQFRQKYPIAEKYLNIKTEWEDFEHNGYACKKEKITTTALVNTLEELFEFVDSVGGRVVLFGGNVPEIEVYDTYRE